MRIFSTIFLCVLLLSASGMVSAQPLNCYRSSLNLEEEKQIKQFLEKNQVKTVGGLQMLLAPACHAEFEVRNKKENKWFFKIIFYNNSSKRIKLFHSITYPFGPYEKEGVRIYLKKNGQTIFDEKYYEGIRKNPPKVLKEHIPEFYSIIPELETPHLPIQIASLNTSIGLGAYLPRHLPYYEIPPGRIGIFRFDLLRGPKQAEDPVSLAFLYRFHHKAFPYNHPAKYTLQVVYEIPKSRKQKGYGLWHGKIVSNPIEFEIVP